MKHALIKHSLASLVGVGIILLTNLSALAAELTGTVQSGNQPIAGSTVTLFAASTGAPAQLAQGKSDETGTFNLTYAAAPADSVLYLFQRRHTEGWQSASGAPYAARALGNAPPNKGR
jgi:hypothetical protein